MSNQQKGFAENEPVKEGDDTSGSGGRSLDAQCLSKGYELPTGSTDKASGTDSFTNMIIPETLSRTVEPSNTKNYENYSTLF